MLPQELPAEERPEASCDRERGDADELEEENHLDSSNVLIPRFSARLPNAPPQRWGGQELTKVAGTRTGGAFWE